MNFNLEKRRGHLDTSTAQACREFVYNNLSMRKNVFLRVIFKLSSLFNAYLNCYYSTFYIKITTFYVVSSLNKHFFQVHMSVKKTFS